MTCIGQLVGLVIAKTRPHAQRAAHLVKIEYKDLPAIITVEVNTSLSETVSYISINCRMPLLQNHIMNQFDL